MATLSSSSSAPNMSVPSMPGTGDSPIIDAWKQALETYKKSLPEKDQKRIKMPTGPRDVVKDIETWQLKQSNRKSAKVATAVGSGLARLERFTDSIDMLAQGCPDPACLLWGSIKFVLTIVQDAVDEYQKLCTALSRMNECLPWIEIYGKTFMDSALVSGCVADFYLSVIHFWTQACKFYRRRRLWKMFRSVWDNYDTEFGLLEKNMISTAKKVEKSAAAIDMQQAKSARTNQQAMYQGLLNRQSSSRKKDLTRWLSPTAYEVRYYQDDFKAAIKKRHADSCQWLLNNAQFIQFSRFQTGQTPLLWIYAKPGAGKTVLSSYLIHHHQHQRTNNVFYSVVYFFCKKSDGDKNTPTSIIRSLLYQLLEAIEGSDYCDALTHDMEISMINSGQARAVDFDTIWSLFAKHIRKLDQPVVILDALDECEVPKVLIQKLKALSESSNLRVIVTSRPEMHIDKVLAQELSLEIRSEDIDADIKAFIKAKVSKTPLLCQSSVHDMIVDKLSASHGGMFLWAYLVLKELKACRLVEQVQVTLDKLPKGLDAIYRNVLQRLCDSLKSPWVELAKKVFIWVVSASRPLRVKEIEEALTFHYRMEAKQQTSNKQPFPYAMKEIELACGSLLTVHEGTIQVIHLTVKEFLVDMTRSTNNSYKQLLVNPVAASLQLTLISLDYISQRLTRPIVVDPDAKPNRMDLKIDNTRLQDRLEQNPFIEYASLNWPLHCIDYEHDGSDEIAKAIKNTFNSSATFHWIEACLLLDSSIFLQRIRLGLRELIEWASNEVDRGPPGSADLYDFLSNWCSVVVRIMDDYGESIAHLPWHVYMLDMREIFVSKNLGKLYDDYGSFETREPVTFFSDDHSRTSPTVPFHLRIPVEELKILLGLFTHDHMRKVFFIAEGSTNHETLHVQEVETGRRLPPVVDLENWGVYNVISYATSVDGEYLCILYESGTSFSGTQPIRISIWRLDSKIEFKKTMRSEPWARKVFTQESSWEKPIRPTIGYRNDGYFYSPIGRIQPATGIVLPFRPEIFPDCDTSVCFGVKGEVYVHEYGTQVLKVYSPKEPLAAESHLPTRLNIHEIRISLTGRFLLLRSGPDKLLESESDEPFESEPSESVYSLYDTTTKETFEVKRGSPGRTHFQFSKDDSRLFCMALHDHPRRVEALVFALNDKRPQRHSEVKISELSDICELENAILYGGKNIEICSDENIAWMIRGGRMYQMDLGPPKVTFPQGLIMYLEFQHHMWGVSSDATRLIVLHYGDRKAQIQTFDLNIAGKPIRCLDLDWPHCESTWLAATFSADLSVLLCDDNLFHLAAEDRLASKPFEIVSAAARQKMYGYYEYGPKSCYSRPSIFASEDDPSITYVTYLVEERPLFVYRVNLSSRCSVHVDIPGISEFAMLRAVLHPSLPLMLLIHRDRSEDRWMAEVSTLDLNNLNVKCLPISRRYRRLSRDGREKPPNIRFSDCGTLILYEHLYFEALDLLGNLQTEPKNNRVLERGYEAWHHGRSFRPFIENGCIDIKFVTCSRLTLASSRPVTTGGFISCPSYVNRIYLLLGSTEDELIRVLFLSKHNHQPPEIRTIRLTFSELQDRLIHKWELENNKVFEAETVEIHPDAAAARIMKAPDGSSTANLLPSDLITLFPCQVSSDDDTASDEDVYTIVVEAADSSEDGAASDITTGDAETADS